MKKIGTAYYFDDIVEHDIVVCLLDKQLNQLESQLDIWENKSDPNNWNELDKRCMRDMKLEIKKINQMVAVLGMP